MGQGRVPRGPEREARKLLAEYERGRERRGLRPEEFWEKLGEEDLLKVADLPLTLEVTSEVTSEGLLRDVESGGVYLGVRFLKAELKALYVGRTVSFASRLLSHLAAIRGDGGAGKSGTTTPWPAATRSAFTVSGSRLLERRGMKPAF